MTVSPATRCPEQPEPWQAQALHRMRARLVLPIQHRVPMRVPEQMPPETIRAWTLPQPHPMRLPQGQQSGMCRLKRRPLPMTKSCDDVQANGYFPGGRFQALTTFVLEPANGNRQVYLPTVRPGAGLARLLRPECQNETATPC